MKWFLASLIIRELQIKKPQWNITSNLLGCLLPKREKIMNSEKITIMHCWWTCKLAQPLWKTVWRFLKEFLKRITIWCFQTVTLEKTLESPLDRKEIKPVNPKGHATLNIHWRDWCWSWNSNTLATQCEESTHWKRPRCQDRLKAGRERGNRGWDGWMASTQWT